MTGTVAEDIIPEKVTLSAIFIHLRHVTTASDGDSQLVESGCGSCEKRLVSPTLLIVNITAYELIRNI